VINSGAGSAYNVEVVETLDDDLTYKSATWDNPAGITQHTNIMPDGTTPLNGASFVIDELSPGEERELIFEADIRGCQVTENIAEVRVGCLGETCSVPASDKSQVRFPSTDLVVTTDFDNLGNLCDEKQMTLIAKNAGLAVIYDIEIEEILPAQLTYQPGSSQYQISSGGWSAKMFSPSWPTNLMSLSQ